VTIATALGVEAGQLPTFAVLDGQGGSLEERLAVAQAERGTPNLLRQLAFIGVAERELVEFQALGCKRRPDDTFAVTKAVHATLANAPRLLGDAEKWDAQGLYIILSRLKPGVETRHAKPGNWHSLPKRGGTSDGDIAALRVLPADFDVKRVAQISATDAEMALAVEAGLACWNYLAPIVGENALAWLHSGNGRQIHLALDSLPVTEETGRLVASVLAGLADLFSTDAVKVDEALSDPKRLAPAAGTTKKKGAPGIPERPHRRTAIVTPAQVHRLSLDELRELHARIRHDCSNAGREAMDKAMGVKPAPKSAQHTREGRRTDGESPWAKANALDVERVAEWLDLYDSGELRCPGCGTCGDSSVALVGGGLKCMHNRCAGKGPPGKPGFRTVLDLVMEVHDVDLPTAYRLLAERFTDLPALPERKADRNETAQEPPPGFFDEPNAAPDASRDAQPLRVWTPADVVARWGGDGPLVHEPTGLKALDEVTDGGPVYGTRWYLLGAPDAGKTALLVQIADTYARRGIVVGLLAVDEEADDLTTRLAQRARWTRQDCETRERAMVAEMADELPPIRMYDDAWTIEGAAADLAAFAGGRPAMLGIDSIQTVRCNEEGDPRSLHAAVTARVKAVRRVATRHNLIALATSEMGRHTYRSVEAADSAREAGDLASAKESGAIEYGARVMFALRSVKDDPDRIEVHVAKNKHGPRDGLFYLALRRDRQTLTDADAPPKPDESARENAKQAKGRERLLIVAVAVVQVIAAQPGIGTVKLRAGVRALLGRCTDGDTDAAVALLGRGVICTPGKRGSHHHTLDVARLPADLLARTGPLGCAA
jgi:KaiC/GvpD/RAD55 family RecA-like ATPase